MGLLLGMLGCGPEPLPIPIGPQGAVPLARNRTTVEMQVPDSNRAKPLPAWVPVLGKLQEVRRTETFVEYKIRMPFRSVYLGHSASRLPRGLKLHTEYAQNLAYGPRNAPWTWNANQEHMFVRLPPDVPPTTDGVKLRYEPAYAIEKNRNRATADLAGADFVFRTVDVGNETVRGVYTPAPARVSWKLTVPAHAHFRSRLHLLTPEVRIRDRSDGATAGVRVTGADGTVLAEQSCALEAGGQCELDLDLVKLDDQTVTVTLYSEPGETSELDYVFFEDPVVMSVLEHPKQVVLVFVDTLRTDRLGLYGYARKTPSLDAFAERSVVFDHARSVSPWTLPAARSVLTGRQPEEWDQARTLAATLSDEGWATTAYVTNAFLSRPFGMGRDWGTYRYEFLNPAADQVSASQQVMERYSGRNQLLLVHFMDTHLPYREPPSHQNLYAGAHPEGVPQRFGLLDMDQFEGNPAAKAYLSDRYDQTVRYLDDSLGPLFASLSDDAVVIVYSDHGEEFWEHGGIEHGHALWDEVLRVPLLVKAPGLDPARVKTPVSLLDIAPTVYDLVGITPPPDLDGTSLVPLARSEADAVAAFGARPQVFGRTLRNRDAWGLLSGDTKYVATEGEVLAYDLATDPSERAPHKVSVEALTNVRGQMTDGLGRPFVPTLRIRGPAPDKVWALGDAELTVTLDTPVRAAWLGTNAPDRPPETSGNTVVVKGPGFLPNEIYILPEVALGELGRVEVVLKRGAEEFRAVWPDETQPDAWLRFGPQGQQAVLAVELTPLPAEVDVPTTNAEMADELKILGYLDE
ncbi:MAG: sulfatase [Myxococcota bacterium]